RGVPYAAYVTTNVPVAVQYSRCDTTQHALAFMTAMAYHG
ncbi:MAG: sensory rhodopsin transducer, partial [Clostridia bacterium]